MITRRDFLNGTLLGTGASLLGAVAPGLSMASPSKISSNSYQLLGPEWTGPGGVGDYRHSNGNTHQVVNDAHSIRDGHWSEDVPAIDAGEFDLVVVGGGIAGLASAFTYFKEGSRNCLLLDNHPIFGGTAKQNELDVDGYRLHGPQGSNSFIWPASAAEKMGGMLFHPIWKEVGLPMTSEELTWQFKASGTDKDLLFSNNSFEALYSNPSKATVGFFYPDQNSKNRFRLVKNPHANQFKETLWPEEVKREFKKLHDFVYSDKVPENWEQWLDSISYKEYLAEVVGITRQEVFDFYDLNMAGDGAGLGGDVVSAYAAMTYAQPGFSGFQYQGLGADGIFSEEVGSGSFPGGNSGICRHIVKKMIPDAIAGEATLHDILYGDVNMRAMDREENKIRLRHEATVTRVEHIGRDTVSVTYLRGDKVFRVKARGVVMAGGQSMNKYIVRDAPKETLTAMDEFNHAPMLSVNVGLRNWRFMDKAGITFARWFEGFGFYAAIQAPVMTNGKSAPLDPDKPIMMTLYMPFLDGVSHSGLGAKQQAILARAKMLAMPYDEIEKKVLGQLNKAFGQYGFNAEQDVAALITNRMGHAYFVSPTGFRFGKEGRPAPSEIVKKGYGRVRFGHSELSGFQGWTTASREGERATREVLAFL